jgi:hypothetical protein
VAVLDIGILAVMAMMSPDVPVSLEFMHFVHKYYMVDDLHVMSCRGAIQRPRGPMSEVHLVTSNPEARKT